MSNIKKLMVSAAGGDSLDVDDVFSTYLYEGTGARQAIQNGIALGDFGVGTSTEFDGVSDYLTKTFSAGTFGSGSKTFTFSAWFWWDGTTSETIFQWATLIISANQPAGNILTVSGYSNTYASIFDVQTSAALKKNSWNHLLVSIDLSNTANRHLYINDASASATYPTYADTAIGFDVSGVATVSSSSAPWTGKLAHVYLDYTYRNLSDSANRRLFIDANGGSTSPSTLSALSPVVYFPMTDAYAIGENLGTGGDFTVNGSPTIVQSGTEYQDGYGEGGLVWIKDRTGASNHWLWDTERGATNSLGTNITNANIVRSNGLTAFNSNGFTLGDYTGVNANNYDFASWTFRKAPKFFDVVTYTGNATNRTIAHDLGSVPGMIIVKRTSGAAVWSIYHRGANGGTNSEQYHFHFSTDAQSAVPSFWNDTAPTDSVFTVGTDDDTNASGETYVAYLFAHNDGDGDFGPDGDADIIKCGSYTGNSSSGSEPVINLGWEPQWLLVKNATTASNWVIYDTMRGWANNVGEKDYSLAPDSSAAENGVTGGADGGTPTATGFDLEGCGLTAVNTTGDTHIYIAIRRGPLAVPESGTEVFDIDFSGSTSPRFESSFPVDMAFWRPTVVSNTKIASRLTGKKSLLANETNSEDSANANVWDFMDGFYDGGITSNYAWMWKRAPSFFDAVAWYQPSDNGVTTIYHNLTVAPEMIWTKTRTGNRKWPVFHKDITPMLELNGTTRAKDTDPHQNVGSTSFQVNGSVTGEVGGPENYISYLFASLDGISKVGSYSGNSGTQTIDCGFTAGARFVMVKPVSSSGNWFFWDTARGLVSGTEPYLRLNSSVAEETGYDAIDPHSSGFILNNVGTGTNDSGTDYIFYAIA